MNFTRDEPVARLVKAGELEVIGGISQRPTATLTRSISACHGPGGFETAYGGLTNYSSPYAQRLLIAQSVGVSSSSRATRSLPDVDRGRFARDFTHSPAGPLPPNGERVVWSVSNVFRFDDVGRFVEEWGRTDYRSATPPGHEVIA